MTEIDAKLKLKRFCYLGSFDPVYIRPRGPVDVDTVFPLLKTVVETFKSAAFVAVMSEILRHPETLPRKDEAVFAYATYLACNVKIKHRTAVRVVIPIAFRSAEDLFLFCKYSRLIQTLTVRKGFSRTTKKAITDWYEKRSPEELREMWMSRRGMHGFTHKSLIRMCYVTDDTLGDDVVGSVFFKTCSELMVSEALKPEVAIQEMSLLRTNVKKAEAVRIVKSLRLGWDQVPPNLLKFATVVELLVPQMSLMDIIMKWHIFHQHRHFDNKNIFKLVTLSTNREAQQKANIHPTVYLCRMDRLGIPTATADLQKIPEKKSQPMRMDHFLQMYTDSFSLNRPVGVRSFITITLQANYKKKFLTKHKKISYYQAAVALAFSYFKRERNTDIFAYTADKVRLVQIPWEKDFQLSEATDMCDQFCFQKSSQRMVQPLMEALNRKQVYDLFLVIVASAGRSNPGQSSTFLCKFLDKYRATKNKKAKFVIISLLKHKKSMTYSTLRNENILEICGLDANTASLIDSFAANRFN